MPQKSKTRSSQCPCEGTTLDKLIQPAILTILTREPLHGYELTKKISNIPGYFVKAPDVSGVYRGLKSLENFGMVTSDWGVSPDGRAKRLFTITDDGRQCLETWNITLQNYKKAIGSLLKAMQKATKKKGMQK